MSPTTWFMRDEVRLTLDRVSVSLGGVSILREISLSYGPGIHGLIGPNGAGKSTVINAISGIVPILSGTIAYSGRRISGLRADQIAKLGLTRTFQIPQSIRRVTCGEFVGLSGADARTIAGIFDRVGLREKKKTQTTHLTLPELRRLEFARVLAMQPRVLILDEIMAGLSDVEQRLLIELVSEATQGEMITIVVEHVMSVVRALCADTTVLLDGQVLAQGETGAVLRDPRTINAYLGASAVA